MIASFRSLRYIVSGVRTSRTGTKGLTWSDQLTTSFLFLMGIHGQFDPHPKFLNCLSTQVGALAAILHEATGIHEMENGARGSGGEETAAMKPLSSGMTKLPARECPDLRT